MVVQASMLQEPSLVPRDGPNPGKMMIFNTSRFLVLIWQEVGAATISRKPLMTDGALFTRRGLSRSSRNQLFLLRAAPEISKRNADDAKPMGLWLVFLDTLTTDTQYGPTHASFGSPGTRKICPEPQPPQRHQNGGGCC
ncbi:hypothetical protein QR685DRAFT_575092 [Neurospora intermedia]|uniref:Uncharacterized protein n=1 Tax=Neurospora intermedia TaxID=5142 RepID=A0ABR3D154_NEUIN